MCSSLFCPDVPRPLDGPFVPQNLMPSHGSPVPLLKFQIAPRLRLSKKEPKQVGLSEARASQAHKPWDEVPSCAPHQEPQVLLPVE
jgi:hypothetical protein